MLTAIIVCNLLLLGAYFLFGSHSKTFAAALALAATGCFLFADPVDRWISEHVRLYLGHLLADCVIIVFFLLIGYPYLSGLARRYAPAACAAVLVALTLTFYSVPAHRMVSRVSAHMTEDYRFALYAMLVNTAMVAIAVLILRADLLRYQTWVARLAQILLKFTAIFVLVYVAVRMLSSFGYVSERSSVVISTNLAMVLGIGFTLLAVTNALTVRAHTVRRIDELLVLDDHLGGRRRGTLTHRARRLLAPTCYLVDLIAETSDRLAGLPRDDPLRQRAVATLTGPHNVGLASMALFALARSLAEQPDSPADRQRLQAVDEHPAAHGELVDPAAQPQVGEAPEQ